ncbi:MAG: DUF4230 domain-containing protein [Paramuribaculum sp.]|nr:DUF4230 domain-containing protein [Paramuribaculum sp.]
MKTIRNILLIVIVIIAIVFAMDIYFLPAPLEEAISVNRGQVNKVETMAQMCVIDIYSEVPVLDTINSKVMFAIQKQKGSVSFDIESMEINTEEDTITVTLPPEIVELFEATDDNSWEVIDTKPIGNMALFRSGKFTIEEENIIKSRIKRKSKQVLYRNGTIAKARAEAAKNLETLMTALYKKPVKVTDPTPQGSPDYQAK